MVPGRAAGAIVDDAALARGARSGDRVAQQQMWTRFAPYVRGLLRRGLGPGDVEDSVQDVFLHVLRDLARLREDSALRAFILAVTANVLKMELRRRRVRRIVGLTASGDAPDLAATADDPDAQRALHRLYAILDRLGATDRAAFVLRHFEGLELTEVAQALGVSLATAKRRIKAASELVAARVREDPLLHGYLAATGAKKGDDERDV